MATGGVCAEAVAVDGSRSTVAAPGGSMNRAGVISRRIARTKACAGETVTKPPPPRNYQKGSKSGKGKKGNKKSRHQQYDLIVTIDLVEYGLTEELVAEFKEAFMLLDRDEDGVISVKELGVVMKSLGQRPSANELERMTTKVNQEGMGQIEFNEFLQMMARKMSDGQSEEDLKEAFRVFDKDNDGYLSVSELRRIMTSMGEKMTKAEVEDMISEADKDGVGRINYRKFVRVLTSTPAR